MIGPCAPPRSSPPPDPPTSSSARSTSPCPVRDDVLIDVHAFGVSFPDLLLSKGMYQLRPEPPFTIGIDVAGTVVSGPGLRPGQRVAGACRTAAAASAPSYLGGWTFPIPDALSFDQAAALPMNYLTAHFALLERGGLQAGETVLVHGAAGGSVRRPIQVAAGFGAEVVAVTSTEEKAAYARAAGAHHAVLVEGFKDAVLEPDRRPRRRLVVDVVGGDVFLDSLRMLAPAGPAAGGRLRRRPGNPRGEGEPAAPQQHRRARRELGRLRDDGVVRLHAGPVGGAAAAHGVRRARPAHRGDVRPRRRRPRAAGHRRPPHARQVGRRTSAEPATRP